MCSGGENGKYLLELAGDDEMLNDEVALWDYCSTLSSKIEANPNTKTMFPIEGRQILAAILTKTKSTCINLDWKVAF